LLFELYSFFRFNTSFRQLGAEIDVSYRSLRRRVEQFTRTLDAPAINLVDRGGGQRYVVPEKSADEATVRLLLGNHEKESLTVYTDGFPAYDPLDDDESFHRESVIHGDGEYVDEDAHVNTCESRIKASQRTN